MIYSCNELYIAVHTSQCPPPTLSSVRMVPTTDGQHIRKNCSTRKAVRPGRQADSHRSVALDGRREMPLLMGSPIEGYLQTDRPPYLEEPDRAFTDGRSHTQLLVRVRTQRQVPLTGAPMIGPRQSVELSVRQCSQNVDVNGPHHRCFELIVSSSFNQPMAVERRRSHELVGSMVDVVYVHVLRTLASGAPDRVLPRAAIGLRPRRHDGRSSGSPRRVP